MASTLAKDHGANAAAGRGGGAIRTWEVGFTEPRALCGKGRVSLKKTSLIIMIYSAWALVYLYR